jgi:hypothetical protein
MKYVIFLSLIFLLACDKNETMITPEPEQKVIPHIVSWQDTTFFDSVRNSVFTYNQQGNPVTITSQWEGTGAEAHHFTYDGQNRLIMHEHEFTHTYLYNGNDSLPYGAVELWPYGEQYNQVYTYDDKQRIVKVVSDYIPSGDPNMDDAAQMHFEKEYTYDGNGNLVNNVYTSSDYTDKPSIYKTNKWWPLVHVNFSENSLNVGSDYNEWGFPQKVNRTIFLDLGAGKIEYSN